MKFKDLIPFFNREPELPVVHGYSEKDLGASIIYDSFLQSGQGGNFVRPNGQFAFAYAANPYLFKAIQYISSNCAGIEWQVFTDSTKKTRLETHKGLDLLNNPNPDTRRSLFIEQMMSYRLLTGNTFLAVAGPTNGLPTQLWCLRSNRVTVMASQGYVDAYEYTVGQQRQSFTPDKVMHWKTFNPYDDYYGLSPVAVASIIIDSMTAGEEWTKALKQNSGRPTGIITSATPLSPDAYRNLKRRIVQSYSGAKNAGMPILLEGGLDWKQMSLSPLDADWLNDKRQSAREIGLIIGVPAELMNDATNKTYSNYKEARRSFIEETILPNMDSLREELNAFLGKKFGIYYDYDKDDIEALQEDRDSVNKRVIALWASGLIFFNEARKDLGYEEYSSDFANSKNATFTPLDQMGVAQTATTPEADNANDVTGDGGTDSGSQTEDNNNTDGSGVNAGDNTGTNNGSTDASTIGDTGGGGLGYQAGGTEGSSWQPPASFKALNLKKESHPIYWKSIEDRRNFWYKKAQNSVNSYFKEEKAAVLSALKQGDVSKEGMSSAIEHALEGKQKDLKKTIVNIDAVVGRDFAKGIHGAIKMQKPLECKDVGDGITSQVEGGQVDDSNSIDYWQQFVQDWLVTQSGNKIVNISATTKQQIANRLAEGVALGEGIVKLQARIEGLYDEIYVGRSMTIARTEVVGASNKGAMQGAAQTGLDLNKEWIATDDARTRDWHREADGQVVGYSEMFSVDGEDIDCPGEGSAENVINCRCTVSFMQVETSDVQKNIGLAMERMRKNIAKLA